MVRIKCFDDNYKKVNYEYETLSELKEEYFSDNIDMNVPSNDTHVIEALVDEKIVIKSCNFEDVIIVLGVTNQTKVS